MAVVQPYEMNFSDKKVQHDYQRFTWYRENHARTFRA